MRREAWAEVCARMVGIVLVGLAVALVGLTHPVRVAATTYTVTNTNDSGMGSLRAAIGAATSGNDTITFDPALNGQTITLTSGALTLSNAVTITGPGAALLTVNGNNASQVFQVTNNATGVTISGLTITGGNATGVNGGGVGVIAGSGLTLTDSVVTGNHTNQNGGGVFSDGSLTVRRVTVSTNVGDSGAGGIGAGGPGTVRIEASTITGNQSGGFGGGLGVFNGQPDVTIVNTTVTNNMAPYVGGVAYQGKSLALTNSTIANNTGTVTNSGYAGGVALFNPGTITNTIVAGNTANGNADVSGAYTGASNLIGGTPLLAPLGNYGGPTQTIALLPGSPALGAGDLATCFEVAGGMDQRGVGRPGVSGQSCDIGAFESRGFTVTKTGGDGQTAPLGGGFVALTATVASKDMNVPVNGGVLTFTIVAGNGSAVFGAAGTTGCTVSMNGLVASGCTVNGSRVATSPPLVAGNMAGGFTVNASAAPTGAPADATYTETVGKAAPTVTVTSSTMGASAAGQSVTFTATVRGTTGGPTPTGSVTFTATPTAGGTPTMIGSATALDGAGAASVTTSALPIGSFTITATYSGDANYAAGMPGSVTQTVGKTAPTLALAGGSTATAGSSVTLTAVLAGVNGIAPTGTVMFTSGGMTLGTPTLVPVGGMNTQGTSTASVTVMNLPVGATTVSASYSGDATYAPVMTMTTLTAGKATPALVLTAAPNPSTQGTSVTFTAVVAGTGDFAPSGSVNFTRGGAVLGASPLTPATASTSTASVTTSSLPVGANQTITASYGGDATYLNATGSTTVTVTATPPPMKTSTTTRLTSSPNPSLPGASVTFTATVTGSGGVPTGVVTFTSGGMTLGTDMLNAGGVATFSTNGLPVGTSTITASYGGDSTFAPSVSGALTQTVTMAGGSGLMNPAPQPVMHSVAPTAGPPPVPQPSAHPAGGGSGVGLVPQSQAAGNTATPAPTPLPQPVRH